MILDKPEKAVVDYTRLYNRNPVTFKEYSNYGIALVKTKNYAKGAEMLEKAIEREPENTAAHISLALAYQELDKNESALEQFEVVFKQMPNLHSIRFDYANLLADMGKNQEAVEQFNIYIKNYPTDARAYKNLAIVSKRMNNVDVAISNYEKALSFKSDDVEVKKDLASCYHAKQKYEQALKYYNEVLAVNPKDTDVKANKAIALHALKKYDEAIEIYESVLAEKDNDTIKSNLVNAYISEGFETLNEKNYSTAVQYFTKATNKNPSSDYAYYGLAKAYRGMDVNEKAGEMYEKAIALNPEKTLYSTEYGEFISDLYTRQANVSDVSDGNLQEIVVVDNVSPNNNMPSYDTDRNRDLIAIGDENYKSKSYDTAIRNYQDALKINPNDEVTLLKLGNVYKIKNDNKNAADFYKKAIFVNPDYQDGWFNLGLVYANEQNLVEAKKAFNRVIQLNPEYAYAYYALAFAAEAENDNAEALKNYKEFLKYNKDASAVQQVQEKIKSLEK